MRSPSVTTTSDTSGSEMLWKIASMRPMVSGLRNTPRYWRVILLNCWQACPTVGVVHYWWLVKADVTRPAAYACILLLLFLVRAWFAAGKALQRSPAGLRAHLPAEHQ